MKLDRVTITGADDTVDPLQLVALSKEFPFVEWGILFSPKHEGLPRWPQHSWVVSLASLAARHGMMLSAHLCGGYVRELLAGHSSFTTKHPYFFKQCRRAQLNFHGETHSAIGVKFIEALQDHSPLTDTVGGKRQFIFQIDGVNDEMFQHVFGESDVDAVPLFDVSHGAGALPAAWPKAEYLNAVPGDGHGVEVPILHGYAGGLGPNNVVQQLPMIAEAAGDAPFWIDMETGVRSDNDRVFDLAKVRAVLEACAPFIVKESQPSRAVEPAGQLESKE